ncbi:MAG: lipopolysaccharide biosynthesis protein [Pirellulaceae bacterium]
MAEAHAGKSVLSIADQAVVSGTNFVTSVLIGRVCGKEQLGVYALALTVVLFARGLQQQVIFAPYMVYCHRRRGLALRAYSGSIWVHNAALALLTLLAMAGMTVASLLGWGPAELRSAMPSMLLIGAFYLLRDFVRQTALARMEMIAVTAIDVTVATVQIGGLLLLAWLGELTVARALLMVGAGCLVSSGGWLLARRQVFLVVRTRIWRDWRHNWSFARWALASHLVGSTAPIAIPWLLTFASGPEATGMFSACSTIIGLAWVFVGGLTNLAVPRASRAFAEGGRDKLVRALMITAVLFAIPVLSFIGFAALAGDWLALLIYGDEYTGCGPVVVTLGCWMLANTMGITAGAGLWSIERPSANLRADVVTAIVTLGMTAALVFPFGVYGAALGMCCGTAAGSVVRIATLAWIFRHWPTEVSR